MHKCPTVAGRKQRLDRHQKVLDRHSDALASYGTVIFLREVDVVRQKRLEIQKLGAQVHNSA